MGKGDKKTKRGKINRGTFGARRPRIKRNLLLKPKLVLTKKRLRNNLFNLVI